MAPHDRFHTEERQRESVYDTILNESIFFWTTHGESYMVRGNFTITNGLSRPYITKKACRETDMFRIVPVAQEVERESNSIGEEGIPVAISVNGGYNKNSDETVYISCGGIHFGGCASYYQDHITPEATFIMRHCEDENTYTFESWTGYYLHYNETALVIDFKKCSQRRQNGMPVKGRWDLRQTNEEEGNVSPRQRIIDGTFGFASWVGSEVVGALVESQMG
jgi:hypothetical protein